MTSACRICFLFCIALLLSACALQPHARENLDAGLWLTARKDSRNQARTEIPAKMNEAPEEIWHEFTGAELEFAQDVHIQKEDAVLVLAGTVLELKNWSGKTLWQRSRMGINRILQIADFDGDGSKELLVGTDDRTVVLLDLESGGELWRWQSEPSSFIGRRPAEATSFVGGYKFYRTNKNGLRFICFPTYSSKGYCFDFSESLRNPKLLWEHKYKYTAGPGPAIILKDMDGDKKPEILLSGRTSLLYQALIDLESGLVKKETLYDPQPGAQEQCGRPYGLFKAVSLSDKEAPCLALISCQVEEFIAISGLRPDGELARRWGHFVEKDWPEDQLELRPQLSSLCDLRGNGKVELVLGFFDGKKWQTLIIDPKKSFDSKRASLSGLYFWGAYDLDGDDIPELIVSKESRRRVSKRTTLLALSGKTLKPVASLKDAQVFTSSDSQLDDDTAFGANRKSPVYLKTGNGKRGILVARNRKQKQYETAFWGAAPGTKISTQHIAGPGFLRADFGAGHLLLSDSQGCIQRFDENLRPLGPKLQTQGRSCRPLLWRSKQKRELIVDFANGTLVGGVPDLSRGEGFSNNWQVSAKMPACHIDSSGTARLAAADPSDPEHPAILIYTAPISTGSKSQPLRIPLSDPPYLGLLPFARDFHLLVPTQTGTHTMVLYCFDSTGNMLWKDDQHGAHPHMPAAADLNGNANYNVIADDHGVLRIYDQSGRVISEDRSINAAYTLPVVGEAGSGGKTCILRANGRSAMKLMDAKGKMIWQNEVPDWKHYQCLSALARSADNKWKIGSLTDSGVFECIDFSTGETKWSLDLDSRPAGTSIVAADLNGDRNDEFILGLVDGRLICLEEEYGKGTILWQKEFDAEVANPIVADLDGDGFAEIIISTGDGYLRVLKHRTRK